MKEDENITALLACGRAGIKDSELSNTEMIFHGLKTTVTTVNVAKVNEEEVSGTIKILL